MTDDTILYSFRISYSYEDLLACRTCLEPFSRGRRLLGFSALYLTAVFVYISILIWKSSPPFNQPVTVSVLISFFTLRLILLAAICLLLTRIFRFAVLRAFLRNHNYGETIELMLTGAGIRLCYPDNCIETDWKQIISVQDKAHHIFLILSPYTCHIIPKRDLEPGFSESKLLSDIRRMISDR